MPKKKINFQPGEIIYIAEYGYLTIRKYNPYLECYMCIRLNTGTTIRIRRDYLDMLWREYENKAQYGN